MNLIFISAFVLVLASAAVSQNIHITNICESYSGSISCPGSIRVISANYGRTDTTTCSSGIGIQSFLTTFCSSDQTNIVSRVCNGLKFCTLFANAAYFSNPCVNTYKVLSVLYQCV